MTKLTNEKRAFALVALVALSLGASACNTVKGLGEDIQSVGRAGEEAID
ncbi:MAG: Entericidin EcnA/B family protein [Pseudomonadota bacterium]